VVIDTFPLVSVRIPAYNHEKYIYQCLDSVLNDSYPNKELLIMDDGSTDRTVEIIEQWIDDKQPDFDVRFYPREHRGLCSTLNELIPLCNGVFLVSLASDDVLLDGGIQSRVEFLVQHPDKEAVIADCMVIDNSGKKVFGSALSELYDSSPRNYITDQSLAYEIIWNWSVPGPVLMVRKSIYQVVGKYNQSLTIEDWDFYLRMVSENLLGFVDYQVSAYRVHDANTCRAENSKKHLLELSKVAWLNIKNFEGKQKRLLCKKSLVLMYEYLKMNLKEVISH